MQIKAEDLTYLHLNFWPGQRKKVVRETKRLLEDAGWNLPCHLYPEFPGK